MRNSVCFYSLFPFWAADITNSPADLNIGAITRDGTKVYLSTRMISPAFFGDIMMPNRRVF